MTEAATAEATTTKAEPAKTEAPKAEKPKTTKDPQEAFFSALIPKPKEAIIVPPFHELTLLIYAEPGVGKTNFSTQNPRTFVIATEPGQDYQKAGARMVSRWAPHPDPEVNRREMQEGRFAFTCRQDQINRDNPSDMTGRTDVLSGVEFLKRNGKLPYTCVTIDIIDQLYDMCRNYICEKKGLAYPPENDFGKTWTEVTAEWKTNLRQLMSLLNVTFITHCTTDTIEIQDNGITKEIVRRVPTFKGNKAAQYLDGIISAMGFLFVGPKGDRYLTFSSSDKLATKDRTNILCQLGVIKIPKEGCYKLVEELYEKKAKELGFEVSGSTKAKK